MSDQPTAEQPQTFHKVAESLESLLVPIGELHLHPRNYRRGNVEMIAQSLIRFSQLKPIVAQKSTMNVVAGNHTLKAAQGLGWSHVAVVIQEMDDTEAIAYLVADNHLSDLAENDVAQKASLMQEMIDKKGQGALFGTGMTETDVEDLADTAFALTNEVTPDQPFTGEYADDDTKEQIVEQGINPDSTPKREIVMLVEIQDAQLMGKRLNNIRKRVGLETSAITPALLNAVAVAHESLFGTQDPDAAELEEQPAPEPNPVPADEAPPAREQETYEASDAAPTTEPIDIE